MFSNKPSQYKTAKVLHWIAGVFIGFNLMSGWRISNFDLDIKQVLIMIHSGVGLVVFTLMLVRWWWRKKNNLYTPPNWQIYLVILIWLSSGVTWDCVRKK